MRSGSAPSTAVIEAERLTKYYGHALGIESISLSVRRGEIFGLLGPNGSGKTTLIRSALGLLRPTSGRVLLFGSPVKTSSDEHHERLGYLPADLRLWRGLTADRTSKLLLGLAGANRSLADRDRLADRLKLDLGRKVKSLSLGNRQKLGLLLALQHRPELLILDEPTSGLDPLIRRTVMTLLREFAAEGGTILYSSHNLREVEEICSRVAILRRGRLATLRTVDEILTEREQRLEFAFRNDRELPAGLPAGLDRFRLTRLTPTRWRVDFNGSPAPLIRWLAQFDVAELSSPAVSLEEAFLAYYREDLEPDQPGDPPKANAS